MFVGAIGVLLRAEEEGENVWGFCLQVLREKVRGDVMKKANSSETDRREPFKHGHSGVWAATVVNDYIEKCNVCGRLILKDKV